MAPASRCYRRAIRPETAKGFNSAQEQGGTTHPVKTENHQNTWISAKRDPLYNFHLGHSLNYIWRWDVVSVQLISSQLNVRNGDAVAVVCSCRARCRSCVQQEVQRIFERSHL